MDKQSIIIISIVLIIGVVLSVGQILWINFTSCNNKNDFMFMVDNSVGDEGIEDIKDFIVQVASSPKITLTENKANIAAAGFAIPPPSSAEYLDNFPKDHYMYELPVIKQQLAQYERKICPKPSVFSTKGYGCTDVVGALGFVRTSMVRDRGAGSTKRLIFTTDGTSNVDGYKQSLQDINSAAQLVKNQDVEIYTIDITNTDDLSSNNDTELVVISSGVCEGVPLGTRCAAKDKYMKTVESSAELNSLVDDLVDELCSKNFWLAAIPIAVALVLVGIKLGLDYFEAKKHDKEVREMENIGLRTEVS